MNTVTLDGGVTLLSPESDADRAELERRRRAGEIDPGHEYREDRPPGGQESRGYPEFNPGQTRDERGRWTSGGESIDLPKGWTIKSGHILDEQGNLKGVSAAQQAFDEERLSEHIAKLNAAQTGKSRTLFYAPTLSGLDPETTTRTLDQLATLIADWPGVPLGEVTTEKPPAAEPGLIAWTDNYEAGGDPPIIVLSSDKYAHGLRQYTTKGWEPYDVFKELATRSKGWLVDPTPEGIAVHEFGHALRRRISDLPYDSLPKVTRDYLAGFRKIRALSRYAEKSLPERFAEYFAYSYGPHRHDDQIAEDFRQAIDAIPGMRSEKRSIESRGYPEFNPGEARDETGKWTGAGALKLPLGWHVTNGTIYDRYGKSRTDWETQLAADVDEVTAHVAALNSGQKRPDKVDFDAPTLSFLDPRVAEPTLDTIAALADEWQGVRVGRVTISSFKIGDHGVAQTLNTDPFGPSTVIGLDDVWYGHGGTVDATGWHAYDTFAELAKRAPSWLVDATPEGVGYHEWGHAVMRRVREIALEQGLPKGADKYMREFNRLPAISGYGTTEDEKFADYFVRAYRLRSNDRASRAFRKALDAVPSLRQPRRGSP